MRARSPEWEAIRLKGQKRRAEFNRELTDPEKKSIAKNWVGNFIYEKNESEQREAEDKVSTCMFDPVVGLEIIELIWEYGINKSNYSYLGVVVEDFLSINGESVIEQIEAMALRDKEFVKVLQYVYRNTMPAQVYKRVCALVKSNEA